MKTLKTTILTSVILFLISFTAFAQNKETRNVGDFDEIGMSVAGKVYVKQGDKNEVILEGDDDLLEEIVTEVRNGRLVIKNERDNWRFWGSSNRGRLSVYITIKELRGAIVSGSGSIIGESKFKTRDFESIISGSGSIELEIDAEYTTSRISGSGSINLSGTTEKAKLSISGSGRYSADKLASGDYDISITGSGRSNIQCDGDLDVRVSGSGNVYYSGNPTSVNTRSAGSGKVRRAN
uniref:head GIN domain-containing protein n=1 Tax=Roseivirga sp. TaxID=1964215 RepID=UPI004048480F